MYTRTPQRVVTGDTLSLPTRMHTHIHTCTQTHAHPQMYPSEVLIKAKGGDKESLHGFTSLADMCEKCNGFAEVFPEHKYEIVKILQVLIPPPPSPQTDAFMHA